MKKLPVGLQSIKEIIEGGYLYLDKTQAIHNLMEKGKLYFLARPRRFGKSLTISTFTEIFKGNRELFNGLYIAEQTDYDWREYPILRFSFNDLGHAIVDLEKSLTEQLEKKAQEFQVAINSITLAGKFTNLVEQISKKGKPVVILIDEYDKPIVDFITEIEQATKNQATLKNFFSPLKSLEAQNHIRFLFITGVSKFSKVSLFSDLNNLTDLTISPLSHDLTGITQAELIEYFPEYLSEAARRFKVPPEELLTNIQLWYNGYSFEGTTRLYNPFSLLSFFNAFEFENYWFKTGTPTFLVKLIRNRQVDPQQLEALKVPAAFFDKFSLEEFEITGLLFQTGYLTIKEVIRQGFRKNYVLGYPNLEVRHSFIYNLLEAFTYQSVTTVGQALLKIEDGLKAGNVEQFIAQLNILLSNLSHFHPPKSKTKPSQKEEEKHFAMWEGYFHTIIYLITSFLGMEVDSEVSKHKGRLDLIAQTDDFLYLMEFKLDKPATDAIQQIKKRDYAAGYLNTPKTLILVGVGFSKEEKIVESWESEVWEK